MPRAAWASAAPEPSMETLHDTFQSHPPCPAGAAAGGHGCRRTGRRAACCRLAVCIRRGADRPERPRLPPGRPARRAGARQHVLFVVQHGLPDDLRDHSRDAGQRRQVRARWRAGRDDHGRSGTRFRRRAQKTAADHGADDRWQLARADSGGTRSIAALLGVQYRRLADGDFNHSSTIVLLDAEGRINARTNTLGATDPKLVQAMRKLLGPER